MPPCPLCFLKAFEIFLCEASQHMQLAVEFLLTIAAVVMVVMAITAMVLPSIA